MNGNLLDVYVEKMDLCLKEVKMGKRLRCHFGETNILNVQR